MNRRKSELLLKLVEDANSQNSILKLAETYDVTEKTIRNDIKDINHFLESHNYHPIKLLGNGSICFSEDHHAITALMKKNNFYTYKLERTEREQFISLQLIQSKDYVTISSIAEKLYVSRATLLNDLKNVRKYFEEFELTVTAHPNKGLLVEGSESNKRKLIFQIYCIRYQSNEKLKTNFNPYESMFLDSFEKNGLKRILEKIIIEIENFHHISLTDESFDKLLFYLLVTVNRIQKGFYVSDIRIEGESWLEVSKNTLKRISQYCGIEVNDEEEKFLSNLIIKLNYLKKSNENAKIVMLQIITRKFIEEVSNDLQIDLNGDYLFFENLVNHLVSFGDKGSSGETIIEGIFDKQGMPLEVYAAVNNHIHILHKTLDKNITEIELHYIVIHICAAIERKKHEAAKINVIVVCSGGVGTSQLISARLKNYFNFRIMDIIARHDLKSFLQNNQHSVDLIISTIPLDTVPVEYVVVSPNLIGNDILRIYDKVDKIRKEQLNIDIPHSREKDPQALVEKILRVTKKYVKEDSKQYADELMNVVYSFFKEENQLPSLYHLLQPEHIQLDVECESYEEAIRKSAELLLEKGYIEECYIQAMIRSVNEYGPYIVISDGFAVPHAAIDDGTNRVGMNLIRLKKPVDLLGKPVQYFCSLSVVDAKKHLNAFFHLVNMLQIPEFKNRLNQAKTTKETYMVIKNFEQQLS